MNSDIELKIATLLVSGLLIIAAAELSVAPKGLTGVQAANAQSSPAGPEVEAIVREVLQDRLAAGDIPDIGLLQGGRRIAIRSELPRSRLILGAGALPERQGYEFRLISSAEASAEAERTKASVYFITVDRFERSADTVSMWIGTDFVAPADPKMVKMCCCESQVRYRRIAGTWTFASWGEGVCR